MLCRAWREYSATGSAGAYRVKNPSLPAARSAQRGQRQHLQEAFGRVNRQVRERQRHADAGPRPAPATAPHDHIAQRFMRAAEGLLDAETYAMLAELAQDTA